MKNILPISLAALLVVSGGMNVYQYTQLQIAQAEIATCTATINGQSAEITRLSELTETQAKGLDILNTKLEQFTGNGGIGIGDAPAGMNNEDPATSDELTEIQKEVYQMLLDSGLTPAAALEAITGKPQTPPATPTPEPTAPPANNNGTTVKPTTPNKPMGGNGGSKPSGGNVWDEAGMTEEEYHQWMKDTFGDDYDQGFGGTHVNPEDLEGIS